MDFGISIPEGQITPLNMNNLRGRMLRVPAAKKKQREILFIYGHHSSLERVYGFAEALSDFGNVTIPDLPGFGGMDSLYKISEKPDLNTLASYLASFVKLRFRNKKVTVIGFSFGFLVVTRMLQQFPELLDKIDMVVSLAGFAHNEDFVFSKPRRKFYLRSSRFFALPLPALLFRNVALHPVLIRKFYKRTHNAREKFEGLDPGIAKKMTEFEVYLWRNNEIRTYMRTTREMFTVNNTTVKVPKKLWHISVKNDKYFDDKSAVESLKNTYESIEVVTAASKKHSPSIIADKRAALDFFPPKLRAALRRTSA